VAHPLQPEERNFCCGVTRRNRLTRCSCPISALLRHVRERVSARPSPRRRSRRTHATRSLSPVSSFKSHTVRPQRFDGRAGAGLRRVEEHGVAGEHNPAQCGVLAGPAHQHGGRAAYYRSSGEYRVRGGDRIPRGGPGPWPDLSRPGTALRSARPGSRTDRGSPGRGHPPRSGRPISSTTSPGTIWSTGTALAVQSRRAVTRNATERRSASIAFWAPPGAQPHRRRSDP
jgi:hypothetical protein